MTGVLTGPTAIRPQDRLAMAATLWGEARGEGPNGIAAVAWAIVNRWRQPGWWSRQRDDGIPDDTIQAVCLDPAQFSCWWDAQGPKLRAMTIASPGLADIVPIVDAVLAGRVPDPTGHADHYHTVAKPPGVATWPPSWARKVMAKGLKPTVTIGAHVFYALGPAGDGKQAFFSQGA